MKKLLLLLITGALVIACNQPDKKVGRDKNSQSANSKNPLADTSNYTTIEWLDSTSQDFGTITEGQQLEVTYRFRNSGDKPLVITDASASCGCTVPNPPKEPIGPGEIGKLRAKFDSRNRDGEQRKEIYVITNTKPTNTTLHFRVQVVKK